MLTSRDWRVLFVVPTLDAAAIVRMHCVRLRALHVLAVCLRVERFVVHEHPIHNAENLVHTHTECSIALHSFGTASSVEFFDNGIMLDGAQRDHVEQ